MGYDNRLEWLQRLGPALTYLRDELSHIAHFSNLSSSCREMLSDLTVLDADILSALIRFETMLSSRKSNSLLIDKLRKHSDAAEVIRILSCDLSEFAQELRGHHRQMQGLRARFDELKDKQTNYAISLLDSIEESKRTATLVEENSLMPLLNKGIAMLGELRRDLNHAIGRH